MPKATEENVLKELTETFDLLESKGKEMIKKHNHILELSDYIVAEKMIKLEYGDSKIPPSDFNMKGPDR